MTPTAESKGCERCGAQNESVGPWNEPKTPQFRRLCGPCKAKVALAIPGVREKLENEIARAVEWIERQP